MVRSNINYLVEGIVSGILKQSNSYRKVVKQVRHMGYSVSFFCNYTWYTTGQRCDPRKISQNWHSWNIPKTPYSRQCQRKIHNMIKLVNPPTKGKMASKFEVYLGTVNRIISIYLKANLRSAEFTV